MALQCGIVGLPNVGKSSLFNALTASGAAAAENFPFCTIEPNVGIVPLPDDRLDKLAAVAGSAKIVPAAVRLVDIAGLVRGAAAGEGLGNKFLAHIREVDGIVHVLRCFDDPDVAHVGNSVDPVADAETVEIELALADLATVRKARDRSIRLARSGDAKAAAAVELCDRLEAELDAGRPARSVAPQGAAQEELLGQLFLLTAKPVLYCANLGEGDTAESSAHLRAVEEMAQARAAPVVPVSAKFEAELAGLEPAEQVELLADLGHEHAGAIRLAQAAYELLGLITFFTAGPTEARAWQLPGGSTAEQAAGCIHTDMQRGFIRAEIASWQDFVEYSGEAGCREAGKLRLEGRSYVMADGDVAHFRFSV